MKHNALKASFPCTIPPPFRLYFPRNCLWYSPFIIFSMAGIVILLSAKNPQMGEPQMLTIRQALVMVTVIASALVILIHKWKHNNI